MYERQPIAAFGHRRRRKMLEVRGARIPEAAFGVEHGDKITRVLGDEAELLFAQAQSFAGAEDAPVLPAYSPLQSRYWLSPVSA